MFYLLEVSRPGNGGQGNRIVDPAWAAGQQRIVSQVALQYKPSVNRIQNQIKLVIFNLMRIGPATEYVIETNRNFLVQFRGIRPRMYIEGILS